MRNIISWPFASASLALSLLVAPLAASAQTPDPAAGNPAINTTPAPSGGDRVAPMASPSNEANIPKGSNPEGGSGNLGPGSGATPSSSAAERPMPSQTANNPDSNINDAQPSATPSGGAATGESGPSASNGADNAAQGRYASPPNVNAE